MANRALAIIEMNAWLLQSSPICGEKQGKNSA
jgi:hypothetical protein